MNDLDFLMIFTEKQATLSQARRYWSLLYPSHFQLFFFSSAVAIGEMAAEMVPDAHWSSTDEHIPNLIPAAGAWELLYLGFLTSYTSKC